MLFKLFSSGLGCISLLVLFGGDFGSGGSSSGSFFSLLQLSGLLSSRQGGVMGSGFGLSPLLLSLGGESSSLGGSSISLSAFLLGEGFGGICLVLSLFDLLESVSSLFGNSLSDGRLLGFLSGSFGSFFSSQLCCCSFCLLFSFFCACSLGGSCSSFSL